MGGSYDNMTQSARLSNCESEACASLSDSGTTEKSKLEKTWQNWAKLEQKCSFAPVS
jgi:hypothetical protein